MCGLCARVSVWMWVWVCVLGGEVLLCRRVCVFVCVCSSYQTVVTNVSSKRVEPYGRGVAIGPELFRLRRLLYGRTAQRLCNVFYFLFRYIIAKAREIVHRVGCSERFSQ